MTLPKWSPGVRPRIVSALALTVTALLAPASWVGAQGFTVYDPAEGSKHSFDATPTGLCEILVSASQSVTWSITGITGSTVSYPDGNPVALGKIRYTSLPSSNSQFGSKTVTAGGTVNRGVKIFFLPNETNHGTAAGDPSEATTWPNWFYYWKQITSPASPYYGNVAYDGNLPIGTSGQARFENGAWRAFIGSGAAQGGEGETLWGGASGIDFYAHTCRHEAQHVVDLEADWGVNTNRVPAQDADGGIGDWLKDSAEASKTQYHAAGYDPARRATYEDHFGYGAGAWSDIEDWTLHRQPGWTNGDTNSQDWSVLGKQW